MPKWIKAHDGGGDAKRRRVIGGAVWKFIARRKHVASDRVLGMRGVKRVLKNERKNLLKVLERREKRELKKAERRVN